MDISHGKDNRGRITIIERELGFPDVVLYLAITDFDWAPTILAIFDGENE